MEYVIAARLIAQSNASHVEQTRAYFRQRNPRGERPLRLQRIWYRCRVVIIAGEGVDAAASIGNSCCFRQTRRFEIEAVEVLTCELDDLFCLLLTRNDTANLLARNPRPRSMVRCCT